MPVGTTIQFRWQQNSFSGSCCDHWALDNLLLNTGNAVAITWKPTTGYTLLSANQIKVSPNTTTSYKAYATNVAAGCGR